jgi:hypothetical protein
MNNDELNMHVFMLCNKINTIAFKNLPEEFSIRNLKKTELEIWKKLHFFEYEFTGKHHEYMTEWYNEFYGINEELFYKNCLKIIENN